MALSKQQTKILGELKKIDPKRVVFTPIENLRQAFINYFGDEATYKLTFDVVKDAYLKRKKQTEQQAMEIDWQQFFAVMFDIHMAIADKKLLRAVILLSYVIILNIAAYSVETRRQNTRKLIG